MLGHGWVLFEASFLDRVRVLVHVRACPPSSLVRLNTEFGCFGRCKMHEGSQQRLPHILYVQATNQGKVSQKSDCIL